MSLIKKMSIVLAVAGAMILPTGCKYKAGSLMPPNIKSIAIAPVKNKTLTTNASAVVRQALCEQFQFDASLKVKSLKDADCILYATVVKVDNKATRRRDTLDDENNFIPSEWSISTTIEYVVMVPGKKKPLVRKRKTTASAYYQRLTDFNITQRRGFQQAAKKAAEKIVVNVTENW